MSDLDDDAFFVRKPKLAFAPVPSRSKSKPSKSAAKKKRRPDDDPSSEADAGNQPKKTRSISLLSDDEGPQSATESNDKGKQPVHARRRSLTPPPPNDPILVAHYKRILEANLFAPEPGKDYAPIQVEEPEDDEPDGVDLDPTLAKVQAEIASRSPVASRTQHSASTSQVSLQISMVADPTIKRTETNRTGLELYEQPLELIIGIDEPFEVIWQQMAFLKRISPGQLVMTHNDHHLYPSTTPASAGIYHRAVVKAYRKVDWEKWRALKDQAVDPSKSPIIESEAPELANDASSDTVDTGKQLTLRGRDGRQQIVSVQPNNTFHSILRAYLTEFRLLHRTSRAKLVYDGDPVDLSLSVADMPELEDEDTLDVVT